MLRLIVELVFLSIGIGFAKAIVEPVMKKLFKNKVIRFAPVALKLLDEKMPGLLGKRTGEEIEQLVRETLESATGESWSDDEINFIFKAYDVRVGADRALSNEPKDSDE